MIAHIWTKWLLDAYINIQGKSQLIDKGGAQHLSLVKQSPWGMRAPTSELEMSMDKPWQIIWLSQFLIVAWGLQSSPFFNE
jgi:hypothetical protein